MVDDNILFGLGGLQHHRLFSISLRADSINNTGSTNDDIEAVDSLMPHGAVIAPEGLDPLQPPVPHLVGQDEDLLGVMGHALPPASTQESTDSGPISRTVVYDGRRHVPAIPNSVRAIEQPASS